MNTTDHDYQHCPECGNGADVFDPSDEGNDVRYDCHHCGILFKVSTVEGMTVAEAFTHVAVHGDPGEAKRDSRTNLAVDIIDMATPRS